MSFGRGKTTQRSAAYAGGVMQRRAGTLRLLQPLWRYVRWRLITAYGKYRYKRK
jgi:hypothetical protein